MTALQSIIKEAKAIRKKKPAMEWKKAVAQASAIYASKHKGKSPVGKKHVVKKKAAKKKVGNVTLRKANYHNRDERYIIMNDGKPHLDAQPFFKEDAKRIATALRKVKTKRKTASKKVGTVKKAKRKPTEKAVYKSIIHAAKVQKSHMSGVSSVALDRLKSAMNHLKTVEMEIEKNKSIILLSKDARVKKHLRDKINHYKKYMKEIKTHIIELKKHIK